VIVRRLIEEELPLEVVNTASAREKSLRHGHISTMHLWWARRPLAMSRAVVFGSFLPDPDNNAARGEILELLARASPFEASVRDDRINPLRKLLAEAYPDYAPKVLDCFAGGGAIPLEALRLGCDTTAIDLNPVAYLIEKCVLEYPQRFGQPDDLGDNSLAKDFVRWATWVRERVEPKLANVFPADRMGKRPAVYFWARTMVCANPSCRAVIPLLSSFWLANSSRRKVWVRVEGRPGKIDLYIVSGPPPETRDLSDGTVKASSVTCPACGTSTGAKDVREYAKRVGFDRLLYAVLDIEGGVRTYRAPRPDEVEGGEIRATEMLNDLTETPDGTSAIPDEQMMRSQYRRFINLVYGIDTFAELFNHRQLYVLGSLCEAVRAAHAEMLSRGMDPARALAVTTYIGLCVDRIADYDSSFCPWHVVRETAGHTFGRQAIAMVWDYFEIDPFSAAPGGWKGAVQWIQLAIRHCSLSSQLPASVQRGDAQSLAFPDGMFDAVIVDPPYYDAIQYADLSDFFYVWLKRSIGHLYPTLFAPPLTPKQQEVIESRADRKSPEYISHEEFESRLQRALNEMARVVKPTGLVVIVFAHTDVEAWERLLRSLRNAGLVVSTSWPMRSEMAARSTALISAVLGSSVVLVCRPYQAEQEGFYDDVVRELDARISERLDRFDQMGLIGADYFASAVGPAFEVFAKYSRVVRLSGDEVDVAELMTLARQVVARRAMGKLLGDDSVSSLDPVSLLYLTWRWAYSGESIPADEAYKLERALDVDLSALIGHHGVAKKSGSSYALCGPEDRKGLNLGTTPLTIDVLHAACNLWDSGRRKDLEQILADTGMGSSTAFWSLARALAEVLPEGNRERTMLLGLTGNMDALSSAAAKAALPRSEQQQLDWGSTEPKMFTDGLAQPRLGEE
jgi:putative DNA methylase